MINLSLVLRIDFLNIACEIALRWIPQNSLWLVNIGLGNGLVSWGNKPLPEPILTKFYEAK